MGQLQIIKAGLSSTIQDLGRYGSQSNGISVSGAMDRLALRLANEVVGNDANAPCIEMTMKGDEIQFLDDTYIAVTGADMDFRINGAQIPSFKAIPVVKGDRLSAGFATNGVRSYLAVKGGFHIKETLGSSSTTVRERLGGVEGRKLKSKDLIDYETYSGLMTGQEIPKDILIDVYGERSIRFTFGTETNRFSEDGILTFTSTDYEVSNQSDRMGYRLKGSPVEYTDGCDIVSGAVNFGTIQVPGNGQPIIMMADCQTVGGYIKIGQVIQADLPYLAQRKPGDKVSFEPIKSDMAISIWRDLHERIDAWKRSVQVECEVLLSETEQDTMNKTIDNTENKYMHIRVNGKPFNIRVSESKIMKKSD